MKKMYGLFFCWYSEEPGKELDTLICCSKSKEKLKKYHLKNLNKNPWDLLEDYQKNGEEEHFEIKEIENI
jgi:hypothetical protein